jgi:predicted nucleic acid-binding Zn ribbon protein
MIINPEALCECGKGKSPQHKMCQECAHAIQSLQAQDRPRSDKPHNRKVECPECGGSMDYRASMCKDCRDKLKPMREMRLHTLDECPECGRNKLKTRPVCSRCKTKYVNKKLSKWSYGRRR